MNTAGRRRAEEQTQQARVTMEGVLAPGCLDGDPFQSAVPLAGLSKLAGGLPDERGADEILHDLTQCRIAPIRK